jgi:hypothetical protein
VRFDLRPEPHLLEVVQQHRRVAGFGVEPHRLVDVRDHDVVQHPPVQVEDKRLGPRSLGQLADVLGEQQVQPREPVSAGYGEHVAVAAVDDGGRAGHRPLLGQRVAAVSRDGGVRVRHGLGDLAGLGRMFGHEIPSFAAAS